MADLSDPDVRRHVTQVAQRDEERRQSDRREARKVIAGHDSIDLERLTQLLSMLNLWPDHDTK